MAQILFENDMVLVLLVKGRVIGMNVREEEELTLTLGDATSAIPAVYREYLEPQETIYTNASMKRLGIAWRDPDLMPEDVIEQHRDVMLSPVPVELEGSNYGFKIVDLPEPPTPTI